jgi:hypothetical protein
MVVGGASKKENSGTEVAQEVECLLCKCKALSSNTSATKKKTKLSKKESSACQKTEGNG